MSKSLTTYYCVTRCEMINPILKTSLTLCIVKLKIQIYYEHHYACSIKDYYEYHYICSTEEHWHQRNGKCRG